MCSASKSSGLRLHGCTRVRWRGERGKGKKAEPAAQAPNRAPPSSPACPSSRSDRWPHSFHEPRQTRPQTLPLRPPQPTQLLLLAAILSAQDTRLPARQLCFQSGDPCSGRQSTSSCTVSKRGTASLVVRDNPRSFPLSSSILRLLLSGVDRRRGLSMCPRTSRHPPESARPAIKTSLLLASSLGLPALLRSTPSSIPAHVTRSRSRFLRRRRSTSSRSRGPAASGTHDPPTCSPHFADATSAETPSGGLLPRGCGELEIDLACCARRRRANHSGARSSVPEEGRRGVGGIAAGYVAGCWTVHIAGDTPARLLLGGTRSCRPRKVQRCRFLISSKLLNPPFCCSCWFCGHRAAPPQLLYRSASMAV